MEPDNKSVLWFCVGVSLCNQPLQFALIESENLHKHRFGNLDKHACRQKHTMDYARPGALARVEARGRWALMRAQARWSGRLYALGRVLCRA